jgi:hypothetical protein
VVAGAISDVSTVANDIASVTNVSTNMASVTNVSTNSASVVNVSNNMSSVTDVAANLTDLGVVSGINADISTLAAISTDVTAAASNAANITNVSNNMADIVTVSGINADVSVVAGITSNIAAVVADEADIGTVASNITEVASVGSAIADVSTVASNINSLTSFNDTYFVGQTAPTGANVTQGDLWFDLSTQIMRVYSTSGWQAAGSSVNGVSQSVAYLVGTNKTTSAGVYTGSLTTFPAVYDPAYAFVWLNGVLLDPSDYTSTSGTEIVLSSPATASDIITIMSFGTFELADHYNKTQTDNLIDGVKALALAGL